jgi:membrane protease YdiL (CAAX protease family)
MTIENQPSTDSTPVPAEYPINKVNWKQVAAFIVLTFGLTWILDFVLFLNGGLSHPAVNIVLQFQMLLPAFSAILLGMFFFKDSLINVKNNHSKSRWFTWYFLFFTLLYTAAVILAFIRPGLVQTIGPILLLPGLVGMILAIVLRVVGGKDTFSGVGMGGGKAKLWLLFGLGIILFSGLQTLLSWLFRMGQPAEMSTLVTQAALAGMTPTVFMVLITVQTLILGPFLGLLVTFGEEYGWRGYLQSTLTNLGRVRGVTLVGIIWGIWHWPVIWMGFNYPGHPYLGSLLMVFFCVGLAFVLGYAVLKAKGVWIAAFLHATVNQSLSFFMAIIYKPGDPAFSFGNGIPGLIVLALIVILILRDPIWKHNES